MKTFGGADAVVRHYVWDHSDKFVSLLWPLLNDKFPGINDIGRGRQDARGQTRTVGRKDGGRKGDERDKRRGDREKTQPAPLNRPTELSSC